MALLAMGSTIKKVGGQMIQQIQSIQHSKCSQCGSLNEVFSNEHDPSEASCWCSNCGINVPVTMSAQVRRTKHIRLNRMINDLKFENFKLKQELSQCREALLYYAFGPDKTKAVKVLGKFPGTITIA